MVFPLCDRAAWAKIADVRHRELTPFVPRRIIHNDAIQASLNNLVSFVSRDFVRSWYLPNISSDIAFVNRVEYSLHYALAEIKTRIDRIDLAQWALSKVLPAIVDHAREIRSAEHMLNAESVQRKQVGETDPQDHLLARYYRGGHLHPAVSCAKTPDPRLALSYLRTKIGPIVAAIFPKNEASSRVFVTLIKEILTYRILMPIIDMLSDPDYWNQMFDSMAESIIRQEESLGRKLDESLETYPPFGDDTKLNE
eukprot:jgi/Hompol1/4110/HPOL_006928-RA